MLAKIGESHARALFPGGRRFDAVRAQRIGLVHEVVEGEAALDLAVDAAIADILASGPTAVRAAKEDFTDLESKAKAARAGRGWLSRAQLPARWQRRRSSASAVAAVSPMSTVRSIAT